MSRVKIQDIALSAVEFEPQVRERFDAEALAGLEESIRAIGVQQPIQVRPKGADRFVVLDGERRCRAAKAAGLANVPAIVIEDKLEIAAIVERQLALNVQRQDLTPVELARGLDRLIRETDRTAAQVGKSLGMSGATVSRLLAMLTLPPEILDRVEAGYIGASAAAELARIDDPKVRNELAGEVMNGGLTRDALVERVRRSRIQENDANSAAQSASVNRFSVTGDASGTRVVASLSGGRSITLVGPGLTNLEILINWLTELQTEARKGRTQNLSLTTFARMLRDRAKGADPDIQAKGA